VTVFTNTPLWKGGVNKHQTVFEAFHCPDYSSEKSYVTTSWQPMLIRNSCI